MLRIGPRLNCLVPPPISGAADEPPGVSLPLRHHAPRRNSPPRLWAVSETLSRNRSARLKADLVVVGAGVGGIACAVAAARNGLKVILTEEYDWIGGQLTSQAVPARRAPLDRGTRQYHDLPRLPHRRFATTTRRNYPLTDAAQKEPALNPGNGSVSKLCHEPRVRARGAAGNARPAHHGRPREARSSLSRPASWIPTATASQHRDLGLARLSTTASSLQRALLRGRHRNRRTASPGESRTRHRRGVPRDTKEPHAPSDARLRTTRPSRSASQWITRRGRTTASGNRRPTSAGATTRRDWNRRGRGTCSPGRCPTPRRSRPGRWTSIRPDQSRRDSTSGLIAASWPGPSAPTIPASATSASSTGRRTTTGSATSIDTRPRALATSRRGPRIEPVPALLDADRSPATLTGGTGGRDCACGPTSWAPMSRPGDGPLHPREPPHQGDVHRDREPRRRRMPARSYSARNRASSRPKSSPTRSAPAATASTCIRPPAATTTSTSVRCRFRFRSAH